MSTGEILNKMAYTGIFATEAELDAKAGENVDSTGWTEANKNAWISQAESYINCTARNNFSDNYSGLDADVKRILSEAASNLTAIYGIQFNMAGYSSRIEAEDMINLLFARFIQCIDVLTDDRTQKFMGSAVESGTGSPLTTKGDLYTFDTANQRLGVGTDGQVLIADSAEATGLRWGAAGGAPVDSVFGRTGTVVAVTNDYTWAQINKATSDIADITTKSHTSLTDIGSNTHAQIDTAITNSVNHIADSTIHFTEASIDHTAITNIGTNSHAQIDSHVADSTIHYTQANITAVGTIATGVWNGTAIGDTYISSAATWNAKMDDLVDDTTPQLGGDLDLNQKSIQLDPTPTSDHTWNGEIATMTAGESVVIGDVCYLKSDGKFWKVDADAEATTKGFLVMATTSISADATGIFLLNGFIRDDTWTWTIGAELFCSTTPGNPTETQPSATGDIVRLVGYAYSADIIYFNPDKTYIEVA